MNIIIPKHKIGDKVWFLNDMDNPRYGKIVTISEAFSINNTNIWYTIEDKEQQYVVLESDIPDVDDPVLQTPKYRIGDLVEYEYQTVDDKQEFDTDIIERIQINIFDSTQEPQICYFMSESDDDFFVSEDEILGYSTNIIDMSSESIEAPTIIK